jgi:hypothetical protein
MPGYTFDPTSFDCFSLMDDEDRIDIVAQEASQQQRTQITSTQTK